MVSWFPHESTDLDAMLGDSPHSITAAGITEKCFYDLRGEATEMQGSAAPQINQVEVATVKQAHFPNIKQDDSVQLSDEEGWQQDYVVLQVMPSGSMLELLLQRA